MKRRLWGGRRFETVLGKPLEPGDDWAESWEVCDRADDQSVVANGPLAGATLGSLMAQRGQELLGRHHPRARFPLLMKFLDIHEALSVQVHPNDQQAERLNPPDLGKFEAWYVVHCRPESVIYAGLEPGVDRRQLGEAIRGGYCEKCLHALPVRPGDCLLIPPGTIHASSAGLLVAEIQQSSDVTYRMYDWNRLGPDGKLRPLRIEEGLDVVDFQRGPLEPARPIASEKPAVSRLVQCDFFAWDRWELDSPAAAGGDRRCHILTVLEGAVGIEGEGFEEVILPCGATALAPAALGQVRLSPQGKTVLLDSYLP